MVWCRIFYKKSEFSKNHNFPWKYQFFQKISFQKNDWVLANLHNDQLLRFFFWKPVVSKIRFFFSKIFRFYKKTVFLRVSFLWKITPFLNPHCLTETRVFGKNPFLNSIFYKNLFFEKPIFWKNQFFEKS